MAHHVVMVGPDKAEVGWRVQRELRRALAPEAARRPALVEQHVQPAALDRYGVRLHPARRRDPVRYHMLQFTRVIERAEHLPVF